MHLPALALFTFMSLCPAMAMAQATLNKCTDAGGAITYSNTPCTNARMAQKLEIDPAPVPDPPRSHPLMLPPDAAAPLAAPPASSPVPATLRLEAQQVPRQNAKGLSAQRAREKACDTLADNIGLTLDKMDQARRKGYTQAQMDTWNEKVRELERKKQQSGCF